MQELKLLASRSFEILNLIEIQIVRENNVLLSML